MKNNAENSLCYGWDAENWKCWKILRVIAGTRRFENAEIFSTLSPCYDWNADIMRRFIRIPVQILPSTFSPHFFPYKNAEISPRSCPNTPIRIFSARKIRRSGVREASDCEYSFTSWKKRSSGRGKRQGILSWLKHVKMIDAISYPFWWPINRIKLYGAFENKCICLILLLYLYDI